jgi:hypothetical protein
LFAIQQRLKPEPECAICDTPDAPIDNARHMQDALKMIQMDQTQVSDNATLIRFSNRPSDVVISVQPLVTLITADCY